MSNINGGALEDPLKSQVQGFLSQLRALIARGRDLRARLLQDPTGVSTLTQTRIWQEHCGVVINQLSGGSKAHWLARAFSESFLMRSETGQVLDSVGPDKIVERLLNVLDVAVRSLSQQDGTPVLATVTAGSAPPSRRFDFVHNAELRPVLEEAYTDSRRALEEGDYDTALRTSCGILESIVTDALEHKGSRALADAGAPPGQIADWPFKLRLETAQKAGLIRGGYARLPELAWNYRVQGESASPAHATENDARRASQVLNVIMRDLNPGR